jgi:cyclic pyranopterin phosphate synthase
MLIDAHNRLIDYLRIAVTDRCNLRCRYCMPPEGVAPLPHEEILTYEEILRVARVAVTLGIRKIRLTGGEPLVRRGLGLLVGTLMRMDGLQDLSMTTNGVHLAQYARELRAAGLGRVNVSMDSLDPERYRFLTRGGELSLVWEGLMAAWAAGLHPIKVNVVAMEGLTPEEILAFARLTLQWPFEVRFIEWMPVGSDSPWQPSDVLPADRIVEIIRRAFPLEPAVTATGNGPAHLSRIPGGRGALGVISPVTRHFCHQCNRLRLTSDGKLRACLFSDREVDLKGLMRGGGSDAALAEQIRLAIADKPQGHRLGLEDRRIKKCMRPMNRIGG